jgi:hypothetical protein
MIPGSFEHNWTSIPAAGTRVTPPLYHVDTFEKPLCPSNDMLHHNAVKNSIRESDPEVSRTTVNGKGTSPIPRNDLLSGHVYDPTCRTLTPRLDAQSSVWSLKEVNAKHPDEVRHGLNTARYDQLSRPGDSAAYPILVSEDDAERQPSFVMLPDVALGERDWAPNKKRQIALEHGVAEDAQRDIQTASHTQSHAHPAATLVTPGAAKVGKPSHGYTRSMRLDPKVRKRLERYYHQQTHPRIYERQHLADLLEVQLSSVTVSLQRKTF